MSGGAALALRKKEEIVYPESDGKPMADNTKQFRWIVTIKEGLEALFAQRDDVFVAGDLLWYPVEGHPEIRQAPDVMVAFGRPKGDRGSYRQWEEGDVPPQVVFEILSPGNTASEMRRKFHFYNRYGVQEYYIYDPDRGTLRGWLREGRGLKKIAKMAGWESPRLGIRFELEGGELALYHPDGERFLTFTELDARRKEAERRAAQAEQRVEQERERAVQAEQRAAQAEQRVEQERQRAEEERRRATQAELLAEEERQRAAQAELLAEQERQRARRLAEKLRALGIDPGEE